MKNSATRLTLITLIVTLCLLVLFQIPIPDPFKDIVLMVVSYFFGIKGAQDIHKSVEKPVDNTPELG